MPDLVPRLPTRTSAPFASMARGLTASSQNAAEPTNGEPVPMSLPPIGSGRRPTPFFEEARLP